MPKERPSDPKKPAVDKQVFPTTLNVNLSEIEGESHGEN